MSFTTNSTLKLIISGILLALWALPTLAFQGGTPALPYRTMTVKKLPKAVYKDGKACDKIEIIYPLFDGGKKAAADLNSQLQSLFNTKAEEMIVQVEGMKKTTGLHFLSGDFKFHYNRYNFVAFEMHLYTQYPDKEMLDEKIYYFSYNVAQAKKPAFSEVFEVPDPKAWQNKLKAMVGLNPEVMIEVEIDDFYVTPFNILFDLRYGEETKTVKGTYDDLKVWYYLQPKAAYKFLNGGKPIQTNQVKKVANGEYTNKVNGNNQVRKSTQVKQVQTTQVKTTSVKTTPAKVTPTYPTTVVKTTPAKDTVQPKVEPVTPPVVVALRKAHIVRPKETISKICRLYKISRDDLRKWNGMEPGSNNVLAHQTYYVAPPLVREKYLAQEGDGILGICKKFEIHLSEFLRWNNLVKGEELLVEKAYFVSPPVQNVLVIKEPQTGKKEDNNIRKENYNPQNIKYPPQTKKRKFIKVRSGNTIGKICRKYKITSANFRTWNGLSLRSKIYAGKRYWVSAPVDRPAYWAKKGIDIEGLCKSFDIHTSEFLRWNHLAKGDQILPGKAYWVSPPKDRVLPLEDPNKYNPQNIVPKTDKPITKKTQPNNQKLNKKKRRFIKVRRGDTIGGICLKYKITKAEFRRWNKLTRRSKIYAGKRYWISGPIK